jgi:hypothetical protein
MQLLHILPCGNFSCRCPGLSREFPIGAGHVRFREGSRAASMPIWARSGMSDLGRKLPVRFGPHDPKKWTFVPSSTAYRHSRLVAGVPLRRELDQRPQEDYGRRCVRTVRRSECESHIGLRRRGAVRRRNRSVGARTCRLKAELRQRLRCSCVPVLSRRDMAVCRERGCCRPSDTS